jgi:glycosyltransferase involved in cell wall biosynthesis
MRIIWFTWKDIFHPCAGGAEVVTHEITKRLAKNGHDVVIITSQYDGCKHGDVIDGVNIVRVGGRFIVYWKAYRYYKKHFKQKDVDIVIDEINTLPFFTSFYINKRERNYIFIHQLCREIWLYQMRFPLNIVGYCIEPMYLWLLRYNNTITVSQSTKRDLKKYGFRSKNISIISEGININGIINLEQNIKYDKPTLLSLGSIRRMKQVHHQLRAFEIAKKHIPKLQFKIAGGLEDKYGQYFLNKIKESPFREDIEYFGKVTDAQKKELMQKSHILVVTSLKEGWCLVVTEANSQGTPAVVYDVDGLRDSVRHNKTGIVCDDNTPENLASNVVLLLRNKHKYDRLRNSAWQWSKQITFDKCYDDFKNYIDA